MSTPSCSRGHAILDNVPHSRPAIIVGLVAIESEAWAFRLLCRVAAVSGSTVTTAGIAESLKEDL